MSDKKEQKPLAWAVTLNAHVYGIYATECDATTVRDRLLVNNWNKPTIDVIALVAQDAAELISEQEPAAFGLDWGDGEIDCEFVYLDAENVADVLADNDETKGVIVPLYRQPQPTLTDAEREAINEAADSYDDGCNERCKEMTKILRGLLERTK